MSLGPGAVPDALVGVAFNSVFRELLTTNYEATRMLLEQAR